jgi:hypothetical protein
VDYFLILAASYVIGVVVVLRRFSRDNGTADIVFARMGREGAQARAQFRSMVFRKAWPILIWQTFLAGSVVGAFACAVYRWGS